MSASDPTSTDYRFDADDLLARARSAAGLDDLGPAAAFQPALAKLCDALNSEAGLSAMGRTVFVHRLANSLQNQLRTEAWIARHPEIEDEVLLPATVIVGLPRTGTTMLHRVLAADTRFHAPLWYEVRNPAPYLDWQPTAVDQRIVEARAEVEALLAANPELAAIHPMDPIGADEEIMLLEHSFFSYVPDAFAHVPGYGAWVAAQDNTPAYVYLERQLKFLQWQKKQRGERAERWLLKAPHHLHFMRVLLDVFPQANVIGTHRDPAVTVPSLASFNYNLWLTTSEAPDKLDVSREWTELFARGVEHTLQVRAEQPHRFLDVYYEDTVNRPEETMDSIYAFIGLELTDEARAAMQRYRDDNRREDRAAHSYTLEEYGLTEAGVRQRYADYCQTFFPQLTD